MSEMDASPPESTTINEAILAKITIMAFLAVTLVLEWKPTN
jgi:hypothetical protein